VAIPNGQRIATLRAEKVMTQEQLAAVARVDRRTIQRLESGQSVSTETLHQVAAPLGVLASDLLVEPSETQETAAIILKPEVSGFRLVEEIVKASHFDVGIAFEPWPAQLVVVKPLLQFLEGLNPYRFGGDADYDYSLRNSAVARLDAAGKVNEELAQLRELQPQGLHLLFGLYNILGDGGGEEISMVAVLRVAQASVSTLRIPILDIPYCAFVLEPPL
jgi:transcriptional regulator with XRE-family HTH domain